MYIMLKNNVIFEPPSMRAYSNLPPKQNHDFVKEHKGPLYVILAADLINFYKLILLNSQFQLIDSNLRFRYYFEYLQI